MTSLTAHAFIDFPLGGGARQTFALDGPREVLCARQLDEVQPMLRMAEALAQAGHWLVGFLAYESAPAFDRAFHVHAPGTDLPLLWFGVYDAPKPAPALPPAAGLPLSAWRPGIDKQRYDQDLAFIRDAIGAGTIFQANHTLRLHANHCGDPAALFAQLRAAQPNGYLAYIDTGDFCVLSVSPELFFRRDGHRITAKPMKGTAHRGRWQEEDDVHASALKQSTKNRAENLMIVDVLRNDLSRIARMGSVQVPALLSIERHPTVLQMTSTVTAELRPDANLVDVFCALFPCASVTGAPKIKATEIIQGRETEPRGVYCGAVGLIQPGGDAVFNVPIRTVVLDRRSGAAVCGIGSGIVWDSNVDEEYDEVLLKSRFLAGAPARFDLIETLRHEAGAWSDLPRHLSRLQASAQFFTRPFDREACQSRLEAEAMAAGTGPHRVRLLLAEDGSLRTEWAPAPAPVPEPALFSLALEPVNHADVWLHHKTTRRDVYDRALATAAEGAFDVLLWNERGELTEFSRGNLVLDIDGVLVTPPRDSGLLDGRLRSRLVESGEVQERVLVREDLPRARAIWFVNSLRGRIRMRLAAGGPA